jgi:hypothetical protein
MSALGDKRTFRSAIATSALGHKQTFALQKAMSALPPTATAKADFPQRVMSALPPKADMCGAAAQVCFGPIADIRSLDDYIHALHKFVGDVQPQRLFGVPMSYFGFIYYLFMFGLAARLVYEPFSKTLRFRAILYAALGAVSSAYFIYLQLGFIRAICSYCLISAVTSLLFLFAALWHFRATRTPAGKIAIENVRL